MGNGGWMMEKKVRGISAWTVACLFLAVATALFAVGLYRAGPVSREAAVYEAICRQLLDNTTEGRQALVGSVWWPPLPVLLRLPLAAVVKTGTSPISSLLVSAVFGAAALFLLERILREWKVGRPRFLLVTALAVYPFFLKECFNGSSGTTVLFLVMLTMHGLINWVASRKLRYLVYLGFGSGLLAGTNFEMTAWLVMVFLLVAVDLAVRNFNRGQKEAVLILTLLPLVYMAVLWVLMNRLIMGDCLYFVRSLSSPIFARQALLPDSTIIKGFHYIAACISALAAVISVLKKDRAGICLGTLGFSPLLLALFMAAGGLLWDRVPVLFCLFPLCIMAIGYVIGVSGTIPSGRSRVLASLVPLVMTVATLLQSDPKETRAVQPDNFGSVMSERNPQLPLIEQHVLDRSRYARVFVCGYDSFLLLDPNTGPVFLHTLDFDFNKVKHDYPGHALYILVHRPIGRSAMDSIHWKYDRIFTLGSRGTLYDGDWGDWRLFEIVQAEREKRDLNRR